jgi:hypothetical protein
VIVALLRDGVTHLPLGLGEGPIWIRLLEEKRWRGAVVVLAVRGGGGGAVTPGSGLAPVVTPHDRGYGFRGGLGDFSPPAIEEVRGGR